MVNERKFSRWRTARGNKGFMIVRLRFNRGFSVRCEQYVNGWWRKAGKARVFKTLTEANAYGAAYMNG